jgi:elongation factor G
MRGAAEEARMTLVEAAAEGEDELLEKYLETGDLTDEEVRRGLKGVVRNCSFVPVLVASGAHSKRGSSRCWMRLLTCSPPRRSWPGHRHRPQRRSAAQASDAGPLAAYVWKTTADPFVGKLTFFRVYSGTINSDSRVWNQNKGIEERLGQVSMMRGKEALPVRVFTPAISALCRSWLKPPPATRCATAAKR